jgi:hypothetical protein
LFTVHLQRYDLLRVTATLFRGVPLLVNGELREDPQRPQ